MRNHLKMLQNYYVNMYIVYCNNMRNITSCNPGKGIIRYRVALFLFVLFCNISQYISKEMHAEIFRKIAILLKDFMSIAILSKDLVCNFFQKILYIYFADV